MAEVARAASALHPLATYPDSDGRPMADNTPQFWSINLVSSMLDVWFGACEDVYIGGDTLIYYRQGKPEYCVAPDIYVVFGVRGIGALGSYKLWEIGKAPDFVLEVASPSSTRQDRGNKPALYASLGVREYWRFDPRSAQMQQPLVGQRLHRGHYTDLPVSNPPGRVAARSAVLDLLLEAERFGPRGRPAYGPWGLFLRDPGSGRRIPDHRGEKVRADAAEERADAAEQRASAAEAENARLRAALAAARPTDPARPADPARQSESGGTEPTP